MQALRQMGGGVIIAVVSLLLVVGGILLSLAETSSSAIPNTPTSIPTFTQAIDIFAPTSTSAVVIISTDTLIPTATFTNTSVPPTSCTVPSGWFPIAVGSNDTLYSIAERYKTTADQLSAANCLQNLNPLPGTLIYVPPVPTVTVIPCGPFPGWVRIHRVQAGDTLFRIALSYGIAYPQLQRANCMGSSTTIYAGQMLWVPNMPTFTPPPMMFTSTFTSAPPTQDYSTPTFTATKTPDFSTPTSTFIVTASPQPSATSTTAPIATPSLTPFPTQAP